MRVFITGASGFIGLALTADLIAAGHRVLGMTRSDARAAALAALGAEPHRGTLEDLDSLISGVRAADGVVHLAFNHDFSRYIQNCEDDRRIVEALASSLAGSDRPLLVTSGTGMASALPGQPASEDGALIPSSLSPRAASEEAVAAAVASGIYVSVVRLPQVHDTRKQGLVSPAIALALQKGVAAYLGDGANRWAAAHVSDVARLYRLALEKAEPGAKYHAVAEEGVPQRAIAEAIGRRLGLPVRSVDPAQAGDHFGWLAMFASLDMPASSAQTRRRLDWHPTGPTLIEDLDRLELAEA